MKNYHYFKELTAEHQTKLKLFEHLTPSEFDELTAKARTEFAAQNVTAKHGRKNFDNESAFVSNSDTLNGFYFPGAEFVHLETGFKLLLIAFEAVRGYDFKKHEPTPETLRPVAVYEDERENLYTIHTAHLDTRPLEKWQTDLQKKIDDATARAELWRNVKRLYKKNGEPFAILSKNFDGVTVTENGNAYRASVSGRSSSGAWVSDTLYDCDKYPLKTLDDILESINKYIEYLTEYAHETENTLKHSTAIYNDVCGAMFEKILKYQTPTNTDGLKLDYFLYTVREWIDQFYVSL